VDAKLFEKASQSASYKRISAGSKVTVVSEKGSWYKVTKSGTTGFMLKKAFEKVTAKATASPAYKTLKNGSSGASVLKMQSRLEELGYLDIVPNGRYASTTRLGGQDVPVGQWADQERRGGQRHPGRAVFVRRQEVRHAFGLQKLGDKGTGVQRLQMRLRAKATSPPRSTAGTRPLPSRR
jgi:uncharacterized protein YgiM (DUF1202 family)